MRDPASLEDMTALRAEIDATDRELSALMAHRARLIARAAELKAGNGWPARITDRVDEVIAKGESADGYTNRLWYPASTTRAPSRAPGRTEGIEH